MAEALAVLGTGLSVASFILQVTDECIKRYKYFSEASQMPESHRYLRVRLQMEQQRFLNFALEAGLLFADGQLCASLQVNQAVLKAVLLEINTLLKNYDETSGKYEAAMPQEAIDWDDRSEPQTNLMELLCLRRGEHSERAPRSNDSKFMAQLKGLKNVGNRTVGKVRKLRVILADPKCLVWVAFDREEFEALITKLTSLNSFLIALLDTSQTTRLEKAIETSYLEILELQDNLKGLQTLMQALSEDSSRPRDTPLLPVADESTLSEAAAAESQTDDLKRRHLKKLTTIKMHCIEIDQVEGASEPPSSQESPLILDSFSIFNFPGIADESHWQQRRISYWHGHCVWVEWVETASHQQGRLTPKYNTETRVSLLAGLLRGELPDNFRAPRCLGYTRSVRAKGEPKFGIVFEKPPDSCSNSSLGTLRELLGQRPKPSLSARVSLCNSLAEYIYNLHSVNWLHKGLRSENVLFFGNEPTQIQLEKPYVTGFQLSRPNDVAEMTIKAASDPSSDIYRHPLAQSSEDGSPYRKSYDIYSLGILVLEIAYWKPIEDIMGIESLSSLRPNDLSAVQNRLLVKGEDDPTRAPGTAAEQTDLERSTYLEKAANKCGDVYGDIIEICLGADEIEKPVYRGESSASISQRLRMMLDEQVLDRLRLMKEALEGQR